MEKLVQKIRSMIKSGFGSAGLLSSDESGFTLTEVLIGISVLTVAIVTGTSVLVSLIDSNRNTAANIQAYYLAQEGIEAVRNIRDTNWMYNRDWLSADTADIWGEEFIRGEAYSLDLLNGGWLQAPDPTDLAELSNPESLKAVIRRGAPWGVTRVVGENLPKVLKFGGLEDQPYLSTEFKAGSEETSFSRAVYIEDYDGCGRESCGDFVLVRSVVSWEDNDRERDFALEAVLSNWKGGAF